VRTRDDALGGLHRLLDGRILIALVERLRCSERHMRLVQAGFHKPVVATLVEDETGIDDTRPAVDRSDDLFGPGHLRHPRRIDEAHCLDARQPSICEPVYEEYPGWKERKGPDRPNPGALKWLKKNDEIGMPRAIQNVVGKVAELRLTTLERIENIVHANFLRLIANDPSLFEIRTRFRP
jgi:hypothetical protein